MVYFSRYRICLFAPVCFSSVVCTKELLPQNQQLQQMFTQSLPKTGKGLMMSQGKSDKSVLSSVIVRGVITAQGRVGGAVSG